MPPKKSIQSETTAFLRSIHIQLDADDASRIQHFHPTAKSTLLLQTILAESDDRAAIVVAPYGSGKSLTGAYALHLIENRNDSKNGVKQVINRLDTVSPSLAEFGRKRLRSKKHGIVVALHGHVDSFGEALQQSVHASFLRLKYGREAGALHKMPVRTSSEIATYLTTLSEKCHELKIDRVCILWDEFGRHLEGLLANGRTSELSEIQTLAEFVSRAASPPFSLALLLHRGLLQYGDKLPQSARLEWAKIEGRFQTIQYVDDSKEIYNLVREVIAKKRCGLDKSLTKARAKSLAKECRDADLFSSFNIIDLSDLLYDSYPIEPVVLYLLPRISARVAQNERTLFGFLQSIDSSIAIGPERLFDYFETDMRTDTAVGGTYKQWVETESALSKIGDDAASIQILKAACLLSLGTGGERARARLDALRLAATGYKDLKSADQPINALIESKLLLHRAHNDDVSIWHGTDVDLRGRLEQEKNRRRHDFDLVDFLEQACPSPSWSPVEYNDNFGVRRSFTSEYQSADSLGHFLDLPRIKQGLSPDCDGHILYLPVESHEQLEDAVQAAMDRNLDPRLLITLPREPLQLRESALDVRCLNELHRDSELLGSDPLVAAELRQMTDDAHAHLLSLVDRLTHPVHNGPRWFHRGKELRVTSAKELRKILSTITRKVFPKTPKIKNEMIVRRKPSPVVVNSRKKFLMAVLERAGKHNLGIEGNFPDASIFRTVLLHTGLYHEGKGGEWLFSSPTQVEDAGLREVWDLIRDFLTDPSDDPKEPATLINKLTAPPYGVRAGLIPVLLGSGLMAFHSMRSLTCDQEYLTDLLPSDVENLCREPDRYRLHVLDLDDSRVTYLRKLRKLFVPSGVVPAAESDLIRLCYDAIVSWKAQLPQAALESENVSQRTRSLQRALTDFRDPMRSLFTSIPNAVGSTSENTKQAIQRIKAARDEMLAVVDEYIESAVSSIARVIPNSDPDVSTLTAVCHWASFFPDDFIEQHLNGVAKGLLLRMQTKYDTERALIDSLSHLLVGRSPDRWDERSLAIFDRNFTETVHQIEESALSQAVNSSTLGEYSGIEKLIENRLEGLYARLQSVIGHEEARIRLVALMENQTETEGLWQA